MSASVTTLEMLMLLMIALEIMSLAMLFLELFMSYEVYFVAVLVIFGLIVSVKYDGDTNSISFDCQQTYPLEYIHSTCSRRVNSARGETGKGDSLYPVCV